MTYRIRRVPAAQADLLGIWLARAEYDEEAADRLLDTLEQGFRLIAQYPEIGPQRDDLAEGARLLLRSPFLIAYRIDHAGATIDIIRVVDGRRDLAALFGHE